MFNFKSRKHEVTENKFIFSNKMLYRLGRHFAFWAVYYLHTFFNSLGDFNPASFVDPLEHKDAFFEALYFFPIYLFSVYFSIYFILPRYLAKRKISFLVFYLAFVAFVTITAGYFTSLSIVSKWEHWDRYDAISLTHMKCGGGQIIITGSAIILKIMKDYFIQQHENEMLEIESVRKSLRLLKLQMHPRIVFESMQSIYENLVAGTNQAPAQIMKLSDLLSYLLYESEMHLVTLEQEIRTIRNYLDLKKHIYKDGLEIHIEVDKNIHEYNIPPSIFLPLLEIGIATNGKPGNDTRTFVQIKTSTSKIYFQLINNTPEIEIMKMPAARSGIASIKERLSLSDINCFTMNCQSSPGNFKLQLQVELSKWKIHSPGVNQNEIICA